jgi:hypothetical protein
MKTLTPENAWTAYWEDGKSFPECAELFGCSVGTLKNRFEEWGFPTRALGPRHGHAGRAAKVSDKLITFIHDQTGKMSLRLLQAELEKKGVKVSRERIRQIQHGQHRPIRGKS